MIPPGARRIFLQYYATEDGEIFGPRGKLSLFQRKGYLKCQAGNRQWRVNRLVCMAFHGPPPSKYHHAAHKDGNRSNNRPDNLYWATSAENSADTVRHGSLKGVKHGMAQFTEEQVLDIRYMRELGYSIRKIREKYSHVSRAALTHIVTRRSWRHI